MRRIFSIVYQYFKYVFCDHEWGEKYNDVLDHPDHFRYVYEYYERDCKKCWANYIYKYSTLGNDSDNYDFICFSYFHR